MQLKNHQKEAYLFRKRLRFCVIAVVVATLILLLRLFQLQVRQHQSYAQLAYNNQTRTIPLMPKRGLIYDRNGLLLADNKTVFSLDVIPEKARSIKNTVQRLSPFIQLNAAERTRFYRHIAKQPNYHPTTLKLSLTKEEVARFKVNQEPFPAVYLTPRLMRYYPEDPYFAHLLGYVQYDAQTYARGKRGLEKALDPWLAGTIGIQKAQHNATGRILATQIHHLPKAGFDVYLSIDAKLQRFIHQVMRHETGAVVVIDPRNGDILALVSHPTYPANPFVQGLSETALHALENDPNRPLFNRALHGQFPLASLIKPFEALIGLDANLITQHTKLYDTGSFHLPNSRHIYHDWNPAGHGWVTVQKAIRESSDIFFYHLGVKIGIKRLKSGLADFGFGRPIGLPFVQESSGLLPNPSWKQNALSQAWHLGDTVNTSIGQGYLLATPLQLAYAATILANHGKRIQPRLVTKMRGPEGKWYTQSIHHQAPMLLHNPHHWQTVIKAMQGVIQDPKGTGHRFGRTPYTIAAKTGTIQLIKRSSQQPNRIVSKHLRPHALLMAFAPVDQPTFVIVTLIEHSTRAVAMTRCIMDYAILKTIGKNCLPEKM